MQLKLYFDENVPEAIAAAVRLRGYDVTTVRDAGRKAATDLDQRRYASMQKLSDADRNLQILHDRFAMNSELPGDRPEGIPLPL